MAERKILERERWQLRHAAGTYWLLDMEQRAGGRKAPFSLNAAGAELWKLLTDGVEEEAAADMLCSRYQLDKQSALRDVRDFIAGLETQGIKIG